jgi:hypothetical protein
VNPIDVDSAVTRLFTLLGVDPPREGSVTFDFHEARLMKVRPTSVITIRRSTAVAFASGPRAAENR